ncbi:MAG TPA: DUF4157 domain-containing protein [Candidatus Kapabacteria bacterium]|nr:DUF4157 domain-containing protein [Candidatus Kapabacteria bacterium]
MTAEYRIRHGVPHDVPGHTVAPRPRSVATPVHGTAVQRKPGCACGGGCPRCRAARTQEAAHGMVQTKFAVNHPDDAHEQEANRVADRVMRMPDPGSAQPAAVAARAAGSVQRTCSSCEAGQEEAMVQAKERRGQVPSVTPAVQRSIDSMRGGGRPLPAAERAFFEPRFGHDFADVRIHDGESAGSSAASLNARAFTVGRDVVFGAGEYSPGSVQGRYLLAHELTHVLQQSAGGAPGTIARKPAAEEEKKTAKPRAPRCDTGCAQRWGQDTTCSKWGFFQGLGEHTTDRKWESFACCNSWPLSVETWARTQLGLAGAASCTARHQREIATVSFGGNEVDILCSDTIPTDKFGQKQLSTGACTGTIDEEVIELSPKAMQDLSGQLANALPVRVCYSGTKVDMCLHNGPGARSFPTPQQCLTRGCPVDEDTPSHADSGWPRV